MSYVWEASAWPEDANSLGAYTRFLENTVSAVAETVAAYERAVAANVS